VKKYQVQQISAESFKFTTNSYQLVGSLLLLHNVDEMESGVYNYDYKDKVVLDVGGFEGDSAVFFWSKGARKVVVYEPVVEHHLVICENICLNSVVAEVYSAGIGVGDGVRVVAYDKIDLGFGLEPEGSLNSLSIEIRDVSRVIVESGADVAKFDCEGAEISLISVSAETLRQLEYVIVEFHSRQIRRQLVEKFESSGFVVHYDIDHGSDDPISLIHFKRV